MVVGATVGVAAGAMVGAAVGAAIMALISTTIITDGNYLAPWAVIRRSFQRALVFIIALTVPSAIMNNSCDNSFPGRRGQTPAQPNMIS